MTGERQRWNTRSSSPAYILSWLPPLEASRGVCCMVSTSVRSSRYQARWEASAQQRWPETPSASSDGFSPPPALGQNHELLRAGPTHSYSSVLCNKYIHVHKHREINTVTWCKFILHRLFNKGRTESLGFSLLVWYKLYRFLILLCKHDNVFHWTCKLKTVAWRWYLAQS